MQNSWTRMKIIQYAVFVLVVLLSSVNDSFSAAYIKFDGIEGESLDKDHKGWIDILSVSQSIRSVISSGLTSRKSDLVYDDFVFTKEIDKASPKLAEACLKGAVISQVVIEFSSHFENPQIWERMTFENVIVTKAETNFNGSSVDEQFGFQYEKVHWKYVPQQDDGSPLTPEEFGWDLIVQSPYIPIPEKPTPTPRPTPPPGGETAGGVVLLEDFLVWSEAGYQQSAVIVQGWTPASLLPSVQDYYGGHYYPLASLPNGSAITCVLKSDLTDESMSGALLDEMALVSINAQGELIVLADIQTPAMMYEQEELTQVKATLVNMSYDGQDRLRLLFHISAIQASTSQVVTAASLVTVEGSFQSTPVSQFSVY
ncbi:MAG: type VI secretion system tube protein Hcp [Candidatus Omnitrophica bacterium]|nr:type VI secretion system tube protein Hcp [Candidatus Omnitrophota bacterium]